MSGKELWNHIENEAQKEYGLSSDWKMTMADVGKRDGHVIFRLNKGSAEVRGAVMISPDVFES